MNPIACEAHGLCIELLPELISADPWGYPIIAARPGAARAAAAGPPGGRRLPDARPDADRRGPGRHGRLAQRAGLDRRHDVRGHYDHR